MSKTDFARYIARSEATVSRLIRQGVIVPLHDGRSVTIPVRDAMRRYTEYLKAREHERRTRKPNEQAPAKAKVYSELGERVMAMGDFIVEGRKPQSVPEGAAEGDK
ncbi:MAG: hypothetical protein JXR33_04375 [Coriobacteriia bacterium]|nr:hypothetical protein [Coriobacteriia bacterium]